MGWRGRSPPTTSHPSCSLTCCSRFWLGTLRQPSSTSRRSSIAGFAASHGTTCRPIEVYNLTKLYNILFTAELARRVQDRSVAVNCLSPGFLRTDLGREATGFFRLFLALSRPFRKPPEVGAAAVIKVAEAEVT